MKRLQSVFSVYFTIGLLFLGFAVQTADAQTRRNEREVREIVRSLNAKVDDFQYGLTYRMQNTSADDQEIDNVTNDLKDLQKKIDEFSRNLDGRRENADDVSEILSAAKLVDDFLSGNPQNRRIETDWTDIRSLLERLAGNYNLSWNSSNNGRNNNSTNFPNNDDDDDRYPSNNYPNNSNSPSSADSFGLTGTYQIDESRSENTDDILGDNQISSANRDDLEDKLDAPEQVAIDIRGNQVTLSSSKAAPVTFTADGQTRTENANGKTIRVRAALSGQTLTISSLGGDNDYTITFASEDGGKTLKVTRRITTDYLDQTVFADSFYNKTDAVARLGINNGTLPNDNGTYSSNDPGDRGNAGGYPTATSGRHGEYIVPNGTIISGILDNEISTRVSQNNDRFKMTVQSPDQFRGATVEGYITGINRSGKVSGRSQITFNFERITLRNGQTYDFAGYLQSVTDTNGKTVKVDTEGAAKGDSQTKETVKRGGIGAGIGAVIGAIAGGVKGAAIGAIIGGGAGAGSVVVQGKDDLELKQGSTINVQSSSPLR